jgi:hypothetical protein
MEYRIRYSQTETREAIVTADSKDAARDAFWSWEDIVSDRFLGAVETELDAIEVVKDEQEEITNES